MIKKAFAALAVAASLVGVGFLSSGAKAAPSACVSVDLNVNGTPVAQNVCVPPGS